MSEPRPTAGEAARSTRRVIRAEAGASWAPPAVAGPLITFRGKQISASTLEDEAQAAREAGYERGRSEGLASAAAEVAHRMAELDARLRVLDGLARQIIAPLDRVDDETTHELAGLALAVGAQLARRELEADPGQLIAIIRECIAGLPGSLRELRLRLHPLDAAALRVHMQTSGSPYAWTLIEDPSCTRGGCIIESEASRIDARLESRVAAAIAAVLGDGPVPPRPTGGAG